MAATYGVTTDVTFQDAATSTGAGEVFKVGAFNTVKFGIGGTSTNQVYEFRGIDAAGNDNLVLCFRCSDLASATGTSAKGETWEASVGLLVSFYVKLVSISGGTSIVKGEAGT